MSVRWQMVVSFILTLTALNVSADTAASGAPPAVSLIGPALRSTDLERSVKFYTTGLGMSVATRLELGQTTEVILSFTGGREPPVILLYKDKAPNPAPPVDHGNGFGRLVLRVSDVTALAARLAAAGYEVGEIRNNSVNQMKVFWVADPDGYKYEITETAAVKR